METTSHSNAIGDETGHLSEDLTMRQSNLFSESLENPANLEQTSKVNSKSISRVAFDVESFGQVFTPSSIAEFMSSICENKGKVLEPSCGNGVFLNYFENTVAIELDPSHAPDGTLIMDFFSYPTTMKFDTIVGNPPYVRFQDILPTTKILFESDIFDKRTNLYLFFIEKAIRHLSKNGELVFIVPREFIKSTSSQKLNELMVRMGTITHLVDFGDSKIFQNAVPNCVVFRFQKDNFSHETLCSEIFMKSAEDIAPLDSISWKRKKFSCKNGQLLFTSNDYPLQLSDIATVKVGAVSGADYIYASETFGNMDFVYSGTVRNGGVKRMFFPEKESEAIQHLGHFRDVLLKRGIRKFSQNDWWEWGRGFPKNDKPRIYVNSKTRNENPFFLHECKNFDGSVLAIFPKNLDIDLGDFAKQLNAVDWQELGFLCDGRYIFAQRSLENCPLPGNFRKFVD